MSACDHALHAELGEVERLEPGQEHDLKSQRRNEQ